MAEQEHSVEKENNSSYSSNIKLTSKRIKFMKTYGQCNDSEALLEMLFAQQIQIEKLEKIRVNTSILAWWLVAIPLIIGLLFFLLSLGGITVNF